MISFPTLLCNVVECFCLLKFSLSNYNLAQWELIIQSSSLKHLFETVASIFLHVWWTPQFRRILVLSELDFVAQWLTSLVAHIQYFPIELTRTPGWYRPQVVLHLSLGMNFAPRFKLCFHSRMIGENSNTKIYFKIEVLTALFQS